MFQRTITICCLITLTFGCPFNENAARGPKKHKYVKIDDMLFPKKLGKAGVDTAWPNGIVPYIIDSSVDSYPTLKSNLNSAISDIQSTTCIKFVAKTSQHTYWLKYAMQAGSVTCSSIVGFRNQKDQLVNLNQNCPKGTLIHETLHALGFLHEHTRNDRDDYVTIDFSNIQQKPLNYTPNYVKDQEAGYPRTSYYGVKYNYASIMHYPRRGSSAIDQNKDIITPKNNPNSMGDVSLMGQRTALSAGDIAMVKNKYGCARTSG